MPALETSGLTPDQSRLIDVAADSRTFLEGFYGTGKTTAGVAHMEHVLQLSKPRGAVLVLIPQRSLGVPYYDALRSSKPAALSQVSILTIYGLARRSIDLFWPLVGEAAGFARPDDPPTFLTIETAQYFMAKVAGSLLADGYFEGVALSPNRLFSQILDSLNKAAVVGFPYTEFGSRLNAAWLGEPALRAAYEQAQECANRFRSYCLENNLLDFSLQMEVFVRHLWDLPIVQEQLLDRYRHLIVDNVEEDTPVSHDLMLDLAPSMRSALFISDRESGHRTFLGADPVSAARLKSVCPNQMVFSESLVSSDEMRAFSYQMATAVGRPGEAVRADATAAIVHATSRYFPDMLAWAAEEVASLIHRQGTPPSEIVILAPFMPDVLRFMLEHELDERSIRHRSHRPSRALKDEPAVRTLLTLAHLAHPHWAAPGPPMVDVAYALMHAIEGLDLVRAQLLGHGAYALGKEEPLQPFGQVPTKNQERITFLIGEQYERLRTWLGSYRREPAVEFDHFLARLFGEVLSQPGFGFHGDIDAGHTTAKLIESVQKFRWVAGDLLLSEDIPLGLEYVRMVEQGVIGGLYLNEEEHAGSEAVLLSPAFTFLMGNRPVDYQVWLNVNSQEWSRRIYQPLTHPHVLSRQWPQGRPWQDADEVAASQEALYRLTQGLIRRCRKKIYLGFSDIGPFGWEDRGPLMRAIHKVLLASSPRAEVHRG